MATHTQFKVRSRHEHPKTSHSLEYDQRPPWPAFQASVADRFGGIDAGDVSLLVKPGDGERKYVASEEEWADAWVLQRLAQEAGGKKPRFYLVRPDAEGDDASLDDDDEAPLSAELPNEAVDDPVATNSLASISVETHHVLPVESSETEIDDPHRRRRSHSRGSAKSHRSSRSVKSNRSTRSHRSARERRSSISGTGTPPVIVNVLSAEGTPKARADSMGASSVGKETMNLLSPELEASTPFVPVAVHVSATSAQDPARGRDTLSRPLARDDSVSTIRLEETLRVETTAPTPPEDEIEEIPRNSPLKQQPNGPNGIRPFLNMLSTTLGIPHPPAFVASPTFTFHGGPSSATTQEGYQTESDEESDGGMRFSTYVKPSRPKRDTNATLTVDKDKDEPSPQSTIPTHLSDLLRPSSSKERKPSPYRSIKREHESRQSTARPSPAPHSRVHIHRHQHRHKHGHSHSPRPDRRDFGRDAPPPEAYYRPRRVHRDARPSELPRRVVPPSAPAPPGIFGTFGLPFLRPETTSTTERRARQPDPEDDEDDVPARHGGRGGPFYKPVGGTTTHNGRPVGSTPATQPKVNKVVGKIQSLLDDDPNFYWVLKGVLAHHEEMNGFEKPVARPIPPKDGKPALNPACVPIISDEPLKNKPSKITSPLPSTFNGPSFGIQAPPKVTQGPLGFDFGILKPSNIAARWSGSSPTEAPPRPIFPVYRPEELSRRKDIYADLPAKKPAVSPSTKAAEKVSREYAGLPEPPAARAPAWARGAAGDGAIKSTPPKAVLGRDPAFDTYARGGAASRSSPIKTSPMKAQQPGPGATRLGATPARFAPPIFDTPPRPVKSYGRPSAPIRRYSDGDDIVFAGARRLASKAPARSSPLDTGMSDVELRKVGLGRYESRNKGHQHEDTVRFGRVAASRVPGTGNARFDLARRRHQSADENMPGFFKKSTTGALLDSAPRKRFAFRGNLSDEEAAADSY